MEASVNASTRHTWFAYNSDCIRKAAAVLDSDKGGFEVNVV